MVVVISVLGLPSLLNPPSEEPMAITVELLPIRDVTNIKPSAAPKEKEKDKEEEQKKKESKPTPPVKTSEAEAPPPPDKAAEKKDKKKEEKKDDKKDKKPEKKKAKEDDLEAILKAVRETAEKQKKAESDTSDDKSKSISKQYNPSLPLSMSEQDAIRSQIAKCWNVPAGAKDAHELIVVLKIQLERDGALIKVELANESKARYSRDNFFRAAADSAMRAVRQCSPLQNLPPDKFDTWREMELTFDPKEMLF